MDQARIEKMTPQGRKNLRVNAEKRLARNPNDPEAKDILTVLDKIQGKSTSRRISVDGVDWEPHPSGQTVSRGYVDDYEVALIRTIENAKHVNYNPDVYQINVLGEYVETARTIDDARRRAAIEYRERQARR